MTERRMNRGDWRDTLADVRARLLSERGKKASGARDKKAAGLAEDGTRRMVGRIVDGQIQSFLNDHPEVIPASPRARARMIAGLSKRIVGDLLSSGNRARLMSALSEPAKEPGASKSQAPLPSPSPTVGRR